MILGATVVSIFGLLVVGFLALMAVLVVVLLVAIIVKALSKNRGAGPVLAGGLAAVLALVVISVVGLFSTKVSVKETAPREMSYNEFSDASGLPASAQPQAPQSTGITVAGTPWSNAVEEFQDFEADVYPSIETAAEALGRRVGRRLMDTSPTGDAERQSIYVWRNEGSGSIIAQDGGQIITRAVLEAVATGLRQKLDEPAYVTVERPVSGIAVRVAIQEMTFENHNRWGRQTESRSGAIALRVKTPSGPFSVSTRFAENTWVEDRAGFAKRFPGGDWLVAFSDGTHTTHDGAKQDAIDLAAAALLPMAQARISRLSASDQHHYQQKLQKDPDWLLKRIADELVSRNLVKDRFTQSFERPYGTIWREAILVDASPKRVDAIARSFMQGIDAQVTRQRTTWFSFVALAGLVFGTYLFLNMATKGYYAWALRLAAVAGLVAAGFVVTHLF